MDNVERENMEGNLGPVVNGFSTWEMGLVVCDVWAVIFILQHKNLSASA